MPDWMIRRVVKRLRQIADANLETASSVLISQSAAMPE
jgi:hypothetical protein